jgi:hypothetical protein
LFERVGRRVELLAGRPATTVDNRALSLEVAVFVVMLIPPLISLAFDGRIELLNLDRVETGRTREQLINLATTIAIAAKQNTIRC